ncbi:hypothetical protein DPMN_011678 [Dreissena polymorpha]|uniref:Uncharacterized protein n=1 Tax=Dreissena polymorpha TaxID=45954 RepID=A0A9D4N231_DREPO|nr:hypothetical protein DPMN_011678 [Dreissena polymorpha]
MTTTCALGDRSGPRTDLTGSCKRGPQLPPLLVPRQTILEMVIMLTSRHQCPESQATTPGWSATVLHPGPVSMESTVSHYFTTCMVRPSVPCASGSPLRTVPKPQSGS